MKLTNTYISDNCTKKCLVYTDRNGFYELQRFEMLLDGSMFRVSTRKFKHIESVHRAVARWFRK